MTIYLYECLVCQNKGERNVPIVERDSQLCECGAKLDRIVSAPHFKIMGKVTKGGGPDKFTADMLGIPLKELPAGLRADKGAE